jgi:DnaJ family protein C protein 16
MHLIKSTLIFLILSCYNLSAIENDFNPYQTLGLSRTASDKDIRQAYKKLAKYWHPDKNSEPNANDQFTKINAAYEVKKCMILPINFQVDRF